MRSADPAVPRNGSARSLHVVVADSDPAMRPFFQEAVATLGHRVCVIDTGRLAIELCRAVRPDLLITALKLPDGDGIDAAAEICRVADS
jgi:DNA-binding response OmpR family regulator